MVEIAIMGAGLSGLSCAITLEQNGITPVIFEKRSRPGDRFVNGEALLSILHRPVKDSLSFLRETYDINLEPIDSATKVYVHSKNKLGSIDGKIGYTNIRGRHKNSFEAQLGRQVKSKINFNSNCEYENLCKDFDSIVLAAGDGAYSCHLGNYRTDLTCTIKGVTVEGSFSTNSPHVWFNYDIIPKGYAWLIPFSDSQANLVIAYPDYPENIKLDINEIWNKFYNQASKELQQNFRITDQFEITRYMLGICNKSKIENTYFVGNCFGTISPGLGFGQFESVLTGVYAAFDIIGKGNYEDLTKHLRQNYEHSLVFRQFLENLGDKDFDLMVEKLDDKFLEAPIDKIFSNDCSVNVLNLSTPFLKLWNDYKSKEE